MKKKGIGKAAPLPATDCSDKNCPFHGKVSVRGREFKGIVTSDKMSRTISVSLARKVYVPKYERYENRRSKIKAHNPDCINAKKGDFVRIAETRPLSKTKNFVVIEIIGKESKKQAVKAELLQEAAVPERKTELKEEKESEETSKQKQEQTTGISR